MRLGRKAMGLMKDQIARSPNVFIIKLLEKTSFVSFYRVNRKLMKLNNRLKARYRGICTLFFIPAFCSKFSQRSIRWVKTR